MNQTPNKKYKLLWIKLPEEEAIKLRETATRIGVSRADFMRLILLNFLSNETQTINITNDKA